MSNQRNLLQRVIIIFTDNFNLPRPTSNYTGDVIIIARSAEKSVSPTDLD